MTSKHSRTGDPVDPVSSIVASAARLSNADILRRPRSHARVDLMDIAFPQLSAAAAGLIGLGDAR